jgi:hypothetical protein
MASRGRVANQNNRNQNTLSAERSPTQKALAAQTTPALLKELLRYARGRVKLLRRAGRPVSRTLARELLDDAHADTLLGEVPWDPSKCSLLKHLRREIRKRTWLELRHARSFKLQSLHEPSNDEEVSPDVERALQNLTPSDCDPNMLSALTAMVCQQLGILVHRDYEAATVAACWEAGYMERDEIIHRTGLTEAAHERARKRLLYASRSLSPDIHETVHDILKSAS